MTLPDVQRTLVHHGYECKVTTHPTREQDDLGVHDILLFHIGQRPEAGTHTQWLGYVSDGNNCERLYVFPQTSQHTTQTLSQLLNVKDVKVIPSPKPQ